MMEDFLNSLRAGVQPGMTVTEIDELMWKAADWIEAREMLINEHEEHMGDAEMANAIRQVAVVKFLQNFARSH